MCGVSAMAKFYRIENPWYNQRGYPVNHALHIRFPMPYDGRHKGYLSCVKTLGALTEYFGAQLLRELIAAGHRVICFESDHHVMHPDGYPMVQSMKNVQVVYE